MKRCSISVLCLVLIAFSGSAFAGSNNADFGLGVMIGEPSGLSGKLWTGGGKAFDFGVAWSTDKNSSLALHADYVRHKFDFASVEQGSLPFYYGIGVRLRNRDDFDDNIGIRFPLGLDYLFAESPFDVFFEVVPILELVPDSEFDISAAVGARYFF
jgi:hypothetical protein